MALTSPRFSSNAELQAASENNPALRKGAKGEAVAILQQAMVDLGFPMPISTGGGDGPADGIYGNETAATVQAFQRANGLQADGVAGRQTLQRLETLISAASDAEAAKLDAEVSSQRMFGDRPPRTIPRRV
jgi:peptidoglycan hydrolase-like protein with peptidoglycan-binding domain